MRTDAELLRSFDPEAFAEFYERHVGAVAAYLGRRTRDPDVLFDLLAETFARAYEHRRRHEPRKGPAIAWLLSTARYVLADAERRGQVPDAARKRLNLPPFVLSGEGVAAIAERSRTDLAEALSSLPESQRIAVYRRVLGDDEYQPAAPASIGLSDLVARDAELRKARDPFEELGERFFLAAGGRLQRSKGRTIAIAAVLITLLGVGVAAAALRLAGEDDPASPSPTPTPAETPTAEPPDPTATPNRGRPRSPRALPGATPRPAPEADIALQLIPDLRPGRVGWCVDMAIRTAGTTTGHRGCTPTGPPVTNIISTGGVAGRPGGGYAIVDQSVIEIRLSDGRTITPELDPGMPTEWRSASWTVNGSLPTFTLHDSTGRELPPFSAAPIDPLPTVRVPAADPPRKPCAMRADRRATAARLVEEPVGHDAVSPSYLSCASTVYRFGDERVRATVLLDARDPSARAQDLVTTSGVLSVRREGPGLLVVYGGTERQRARLLREIRVTGP